MAGEYFRWKYRDVKPDPKPVYTKAELRRNWWEYNWKFVLLGVAAAVFAVMLIKTMFFRTEPDYEVAFVSAAGLPDTVREALTARLEELGEDVNGDGQVLVQVNVYDIGFDDESAMDVQTFAANTTRLTVDLSSGQLYIIFTDDPEGLQTRTGALSFLDGGIPSGEEGNDAQRWREMVYPWPDCPVLRGMDVGTYTAFIDPGGEQLDGQRLMDNIYVGRRVILSEKDEERYAAAHRLWLALTEGAGDGQ